MKLKLFFCYNLELFSLFMEGSLPFEIFKGVAPGDMMGSDRCEAGIRYGVSSKCYKESKQY